jgi:hypothetical protein
MRTMLVTIVLALGLAGAATVAEAQVCGDADGSGAVTVTDGVQTLRAAAGLDSPCTAGACDVDGSGAITVTDGVNVLQKAAGLLIDERCAGSSAGQPATILKELQPLLKLGLPFATGAPVTACANAPEGEVLVDVETPGVTITAFDTCQVDDVTLFGDVTVEPGLMTFGFFEADTVGAEDFIADYDGEVVLAPTGAGGQSLTGLVDITTESAGALTMDLANVVVTTGTLTSGSATVDLVDSDISDAFTAMVLTFDGSGVANVVATQANGGTSTHRLDIATGNLL